MATSQLAPTTGSTTNLRISSELLHRLAEARRRTSELFELLRAEAIYDRPIPERHRLVFYLGHLEAFDWNLLSGPLGLISENPAYDQLFAFGIDPVDGGLPTDQPSDWPTVAQVEKYNRSVRGKIDEALQSEDALRAAPPELLDGTLLNVAIEHRLMHAETLAYLLHNLPADRKIFVPTPSDDAKATPQQRQTQIPAGVATLGRAQDSGFGWDNEFGEKKLNVPAFAIDVFPVTNEEYSKFVQADGYKDQRYWGAEDWLWLQREKIQYPHFWSLRAGSPTDPAAKWDYLGMFETMALPKAWPVYVTHAEASAYARWAGKKLPTEEQWHRAAYGTAEGQEREYPWGNTRPDATQGNFHYERWEANRVDAYPRGESAFGVFDLLGNGWEWTSTQFGPFPGFKAFSFYPGYSANFFDGKHFVMKGGSARTDASMLRRSFRNWFQPHYSYVYAKFRCVKE